MKYMAICVAAIGLSANAIPKEVEDHQLPAHSPWVAVQSDNFKFHIARIDVSLTISEIESPPPKDFSSLVNCATWFIHHWQHTKNLEGLRSLLEWWDAFQDSDPFEMTSHINRSATERSYSHLIDYGGFYFLVGTMRGEDGSKVRAIGTYRWDNLRDRFSAVLDTPEFSKVSGHKFRAALGTMDVEALSSKGTR